MVKNLPAKQETRVQFLCWEVPWIRKWRPTLVALPGKSHGQRGLAGCSSWGHKELDTTEQPNSNSSTQTIYVPAK